MAGGGEDEFCLYICLRSGPEGVHPSGLVVWRGGDGKALLSPGQCSNGSRVLAAKVNSSGRLVACGFHCVNSQPGRLGFPEMLAALWWDGSEDGASKCEFAHTHTKGDRQLMKGHEPVGKKAEDDSGTRRGRGHIILKPTSVLLCCIRRFFSQQVLSTQNADILQLIFWQDSGQA